MLAKAVSCHHVFGSDAAFHEPPTLIRQERVQWNYLMNFITTRTDSEQQLPHGAPLLEKNKEYISLISVWQYDTKNKIRQADNIDEKEKKR
jgi:hypothetical protein